MTRRHYIEIAAMLKSMNVDPDHCESCAVAHMRTACITRELALIMKRDNPRFKASKFFEAAGYPELIGTAQGLN